MARKPHLLTKLVVHEVSGVDRGAGEGVQIVLMKRLDGESPYASIDKSDLPDGVAAYLKREFSADQRKNLMQSGAAMPDGGFPIEGAGDLDNAIGAIGRANNPKAAKQHIISRAKALGLSDKIPQEWTHTQPAKKALIEGLVAIAKAAISAGAPMGMVKRAQDALWKVIDSTANGDGAGDDDLHKAFDECAAFIAGHVPSTSADAFGDVSKRVIAKTFSSTGEVEMTPQEIEALVTKTVGTATAPLLATIAKQNDEITVLKMSPVAQKHFAGLTDEAAKKAFAAKKPGEQDKEAEDCAKALIEKADLPPEVKEVLKRTETIAAENVDLKKRLDASEEITKAAEFKKRATDLGLAEADGEIMRKAYGGDADAQKKLDEKIKALSKQANPKLFTELGKGVGEGGSVEPYDQIVAKADELRKSESGKGLTKEQAFAKVYNDPANSEIVAAYKAADMAKRMGRAA